MQVNSSGVKAGHRKWEGHGILYIEHATGDNPLP